MNKIGTWLLACCCAVWGGTVLADGHGEVHGFKTSANKKLAQAWVEAGHRGQADFLKMVQENMADDGVTIASRYVGFGFQFDQDNEKEMEVVAVTEGTPASKVLKVGDVFESVQGVPADKENRYRLDFRGKPGEPVKAVIRRDGKSMPIEVKRGIIAARYDKAGTIANIKLGNAETWPVTKGQIDEIIGEGNVVYVVHSVTDVDDVNGASFENRMISRFVFNDEGKVSWASNRGESRFVLEQTGYTISR